MQDKFYEHDVVGELVGYAYVSSNGQLVIDRHASDEEHLTATATRTSPPLHDCRMYVGDIVPKEWLGGHGKFTIRRKPPFDGGASEVTIVFERS